MTPRRVRDTESVRVRLPKALLSRVRVFAHATQRPFAFACEKLLTDAVDRWEQRNGGVAIAADQESPEEAPR